MPFDICANEAWDRLRLITTEDPDYTSTPRDKDNTMDYLILNHATETPGPDFGTPE